MKVTGRSQDQVELVPTEQLHFEFPDDGFAGKRDFIIGMHCSIHIFMSNLGSSVSEILQTISAVRHFGGRSGMIWRAVCRNQGWQI